MSWRCIVPNCTSNKYKGSQKFSTFRVPKDEALREKWAKSIPGVPPLKCKSRICERHFEKEFLIKEYIKLDNSGNVIAQVPLGKARLTASAVPTIFEETCEFTDQKVQTVAYCTDDHTYALPASSLTEKKSVKSSLQKEESQNSSDGDEKTKRNKEDEIPQPEDSSTIILNVVESDAASICDESNINAISSIQQTEQVKKNDICLNINESVCKRKLKEGETISESDLLAQQCNKKVKVSNVVTAPVKLANSIKSPGVNNSDTNLATKSGHNDSQVGLANSSDGIIHVNIEYSPTEFQYSPVDIEPLFGSDEKCDHKTQEKNLEADRQCLSNSNLQSVLASENNNNEGGSINCEDGQTMWTNVTFDSTTFKLKYFGNDDPDNTSRIKLPKPWNANKVFNRTEESLLLTCVVPMHKTQKFILEKAVNIKPSREMVYEVYSTPVDVTNIKIPQVLEKISTLPEILKKFKDMRICKGIEAMSLKNKQENADLQRDIHSNLRHKDCSILSINSQRCNNCKRYMNKYCQKIRPIQNTEKVQRTTTNSPGQVNYQALRKKMWYQAKERKPKHTIESLTELIKNHQAKVARIPEIVLEIIPKSERAFVKEIILAAQKLDPSGNSYSNEFMTLCVMMSIRSPSYYEFLRKNEILPVPSTRTVREYLILVGNKSS